MNCRVLYNFVLRVIGVGVCGYGIQFIEDEWEKQAHYQIVCVVGCLAISCLHFSVIPLFIPEGDQKFAREADFNCSSDLPASECQIKNLEPKIQFIGFFLIQIETDNYLRDKSLIEILNRKTWLIFYFLPDFYFVFEGEDLHEKLNKTQTEVQDHQIEVVIEQCLFDQIYRLLCIDFGQERV